MSGVVVEEAKGPPPYPRNRAGRLGGAEVID